MSRKRTYTGESLRVDVAQLPLLRRSGSWVWTDEEGLRTVAELRWRLVRPTPGTQSEPLRPSARTLPRIPPAPFRTWTYPRAGEALSWDYRDHGARRIQGRGHLWVPDLTAGGGTPHLADARVECPGCGQYQATLWLPPLGDQWMCKGCHQLVRGEDPHDKLVAKLVAAIEAGRGHLVWALLQKRPAGVDRWVLRDARAEVARRRVAAQRAERAEQVREWNRLAAAKVRERVAEHRAVDPPEPTGWDDEPLPEMGDEHLEWDDLLEDWTEED